MRLFLLSSLLWLLFAIYSVPIKADASSSPEIKQSRVTVYFFWGDGCSHCAQAKPFLYELVRRYPQVDLKMFEVWHSPANVKVFESMAAAYGTEPKMVPSIFIGERYFEGFNANVANQLELAVRDCLEKGCIDKGAAVIPPRARPESTKAPSVIPKEDNELKPPAPSPLLPSAPSPLQQNQDILYVPFVGELNLAGQSLLVSTILISFVDGFNPCSIWVLTILLAIVLHSGSRLKIIVIGLVYILVTAIVYALFIAGLFTMFSIINYFIWIQTAVSLIALFFAIINIKDYFWYKEGLSFTISNEEKPGLYKNMRKIIEAGESIYGMIAATVI